MDYLALFRTLIRHKFVVACVMLATMAGVAFVFFGTPRLYKQTSSVVILQPRFAPSQADLKESPELASVDPYNPFSGDASLIVGVVSARLNNDQTRESFQAKGLDPNYEVAGALNYGAARPELLITAFGSSAHQVSETRIALTDAVEAQLTAAQEQQGVAEYYMVGALPVEPTTPPEPQTSGKMRSALGMGVVGAIVLFGLVSVLTAFDQYREQRASAARGSDHSTLEDHADGDETRAIARPRAEPDQAALVPPATHGGSLAGDSQRTNDSRGTGPSLAENPAEERAMASHAGLPRDLIAAD